MNSSLSAVEGVCFLVKDNNSFFRDFQQLETISSKISIENFGFKTSWCCCWFLTFLTVYFAGEAFLLLLKKINCIYYTHDLPDNR